MDCIIPLGHRLERSALVADKGSNDDLFSIVAAIAGASRQIANLVALGEFAPNRAQSGFPTLMTGWPIEIGLAAAPARRAEDIFVEAMRDHGVKEIISAGRDEQIALDDDGLYAVAIDALDGASNIDTNMPLGTIFSISFAGDASTARSGSMQLAAGFIVYGPQTKLVLTFGDGVDIFTLDRGAGVYRLSEEGVQVPPTTSEYAIDASNYRNWPSAVRSLIDDNLDEAGERGAQTFNMRWIGSLVAEAYRILMRGGVFLCPPDMRHTCEKRCQRLLTAAHPIAFIMEQAGAHASTGHERVLERATSLPGERTPFIFGSRDVVDRIDRLHALPESFSETAPLFARRGLFRD